MPEILLILTKDPLFVLFGVVALWIAVQGFTQTAASMFSAIVSSRRTSLDHKEKMAQIQANAELAKAIRALPESKEREELVKQLLEAYDEAGADLHNDKKIANTRWG